MSESAAAVVDEAFAIERRLLVESMAVGLALAVLGLVVGFATGLQIILFDGFYSFLGIGLSYMALTASRIVAAGPTPNYPFGREALTPLIVGFEGVALLATCAYASIDAVLTILDGGSRPPTGWAVAYAGIGFVVPMALFLRLRTDPTRSELVAAESIQWLSGGVLGLGMLVAFVAAILVQGTGWSEAAHYVDPALVLLACSAFVIPPITMVRTTYRELLEGSPDEALQAEVRRAVATISASFELGTHHLRMTKLGRKVYVEIDFVVRPEWQVGVSDRVRRELTDALDPLPHDVWLTVEFTADPSWGE